MKPVDVFIKLEDEGYRLEDVKKSLWCHHDIVPGYEVGVFDINIKGGYFCKKCKFGKEFIDYVKGFDSLFYERPEDFV